MKRVLCAIDLSDVSIELLRYANAIVQRDGGCLTVLHVVPTFDTMEVHAGGWFDPVAVAPERLVAVIRESGYGAELPRSDTTAEAAFESQDRESRDEAATVGPIPSAKRPRDASASAAASRSASASSTLRWISGCSSSSRRNERSVITSVRTGEGAVRVEASRLLLVVRGPIARQYQTSQEVKRTRIATLEAEIRHLHARLPTPRR